MTSRTINLIVVHCSATDPDLEIGAKEIREWHLERGWNDIGYHYVIRRSGRLENGRSDEKIGAHAKGHNADSLGICLVGGVNADERNKAEFNYTVAQMDRLVKLLKELQKKHPDAKVVGHRDLDSKKACPCFNVQEWWKGN